MRFSPFTVLVLTLVCLAHVIAEENEPVDAAIVQRHMDLDQVGTNAPASAPDEGTVHVLWEGTSLTELVITGHKLNDHTNLCYVRTSQRMDSKRYELQVLYYAGAYLDAQKNLHIKYLGGSLRGPEAVNWSPDNFMMNQEGSVLVIDQLKRSSRGVVLIRYDTYQKQSQRFMADWTGVL